MERVRAEPTARRSCPIWSFRAIDNLRGVVILAGYGSQDGHGLHLLKRCTAFGDEGGGGAMPALNRWEQAMLTAKGRCVIATTLRLAQTEGFKAPAFLTC